MTSALLFLLVFGSALVRMAPGIALEDSGEFSTAAVTLTVTHPPGYPLYLLAGKLASLAPVGSPAFRLGCFSAMGMGVAAVQLMSCAREAVGASTPVAAGCALALAWAPAAAFQSALADKYGLNLALLCALIRLLWAARNRTGAGWPAIALVAGISFSHHMMTLYLAPAALFLAVRDRLWRNRRAMAVAAFLAAPGLSLKPAALPALSSHAPSLMYAPLDGAAILRRYLSARDYSGRFAAYTPLERVVRFWTHGLAELGRQAGLPAVVLATAGWIALRRSTRGVLAAGGVGVLFALVLVASFQIAGVGYYLLPVVAFVVLLAAAGAESLGRRAGRRAPAVLAALVALEAGVRGLPRGGLSRYYGASDWGRNLLASMDYGGVLVTQHDDDFYPPMYLQRVNHERNDVVVVHRPFLTRLWHHAQVERLHPDAKVLDPKLVPWGQTATPTEVVNIFIRSQFGRRHLAFSYLANEETVGGFLLHPDGAAFRIARVGAEPPLPDARSFAARLKRFRWRFAFGRYPGGSRFAEVAGAPATLWTELALRWWSAERFDTARACLAQALRYPYTRVVPADLENVKATMNAGFVSPARSD